MLFRHLIALSLVGFLGFLAVPCCAQAQGQASDPDLLFHLSFDRKTAIADYAQGNPNPIDFDANLEFRSLPGPDGSSAFNLIQGESLQYRVPGNINPREGTIVMWIAAQDYDPGLIRKSDPVLSHKPYMLVRFKNANNWVDLFLYQYYDDSRAMFYWNSSWSPRKDYRLTVASLSEKRKKQWFQIAATWDQEMIRIYRDGEFQSENRLPQDITTKAIQVFKPSAKSSFIGVRTALWPGKGSDGDTHTAVDDIRIYRRALTSIEIKRLYVKMAGESAQSSEPLPDFDVQLDGVDDGGPLDRVLMSLDYRSLDATWRHAIKAGSVKAQAQVSHPDKHSSIHAWDVIAEQEQQLVDRIAAPGPYVIQITLTRSGGASVTSRQTIERPSTRWADSTLGLEDTIPSPWTAMQWQAPGTVNVWGRVYQFADAHGQIHPFPQQVTHTGDKLLSKPARLVVVTDQGEADITYTLTKANQDAKSFLILKGQGHAATFTLDWTTRVDFDGLARTDFTIHGKPKVKKMFLAWTVARPFSEYVLDPILKQTGEGTFEAGFPYGGRTSTTLLWLTSDRKGFCWIPEHDGNWVYRDRQADRPIRAKVDAAGGDCTITLINKPVTIAQDAAYHAMFIATPSRALPERARSLSFGGYGRFDQCEDNIILHQGEGQDGIFSLKPTEHWGQALKKNHKVKGMLPYAAATGLNNQCLEGQYFGRYWAIPSGPSERFRDPITGNLCMSISVLPGTRYTDYIMDNLEHLYTHQASGPVAGIYYDLAGNNICDNPLNGTRFTDDFGRTTAKMTVMGLREHMLRTLRVSREHGKIVMLHAHSYYNPAIHSLGDFWYPGEQYTTLIRKTQSPYVYNDVISDDVYRTELNMHIKGSAIRFLGNLGRADRRLGNAEQTLAMCTPLLLHDVPIAIAYEDGPTINRIWTIQKSYALDDAKVVFFYDAENKVRSDQPQVQVTYYLCPDGRVFLIAGNRAKEACHATIDVSGLGQGRTVVNEWTGKPMPLQNGIFTVDLPARHFGLFGLSSETK